MRQVAEEAPGFMPVDEGLALYNAAAELRAPGPLVEVGSYCGKSAVYLGAAARESARVLFSVDHHRGSEEHQPGEGFHDPRLVGDDGRIDTLLCFRRTIAAAGLEDVVVGVVGSSTTVARHWSSPLAMVFIDGGHSSDAAASDYECWAPLVVTGGRLAIHDVFEDPAEGGRPPFEIYRRALASGSFRRVGGAGSLRVLERVGDGIG
jgi:MMP 1-O-methyltransferase